MPKIEKKPARLQLLLNNILESIHKSTETVFEQRDFSSTTVDGEAEIMHNGQMIGYVNYIAYVDVLAEPTGGDYDYPPQGGDTEIILESASVSQIYGHTDIELKNVASVINLMLVNEEGKKLNF